MTRSSLTKIVAEVGILTRRLVAVDGGPLRDERNRVYTQRADGSFATFDAGFVITPAQITSAVTTFAK
jgi:hypothetical protein